MMSKDTIYREDAIKAIKEHHFFINNRCKYPSEGCVEVIEDAVNVPSADRLQGKWIDISEWYAPRQKCSICETVVDGYGSNYCPNCGAKMKGADDEISRRRNAGL